MIEIGFYSKYGYRFNHFPMNNNKCICDIHSFTTFKIRYAFPIFLFGFLLNCILLQYNHIYLSWTFIYICSLFKCIIFTFLSLFFHVFLFRFRLLIIAFNIRFQFVCKLYALCSRYTEPKAVTTTKHTHSMFIHKVPLGSQLIFGLQFYFFPTVMNSTYRIYDITCYTSVYLCVWHIVVDSSNT